MEGTVILASCNYHFTKVQKNLVQHPRNFILFQAFQFTDEHGEVCPAGWKPGKATMKPDPEASKTYFESNN